MAVWVTVDALCVASSRNAIELRQSHLLPCGAAPETQAAQSEAWTAAVTYAALLHDLGKIAADLRVEYTNGRTWHPEDALWLVSKTVCDKLRAHLLAQGIDGIPQSNTAVFNVLQEHGIAQANPEGKAIWVATVTGDNGWSHRFTLLKLAPALIWEADTRPPSFAGTVTVETSTQSPAPPNEDLTQTDPPEGLWDFTLLEEAPPPRMTEDADNQPSPGQHFMAWLARGVRNHSLRMNDAKALVHTVDNTVFLVTPGLFQRYAQEHPYLARLAKQDKLPDWEWAQKHFEHPRQHRKQPNDLNIWTCNVQGPRKRSQLHGYLLTDPGNLLDELALNNPYLQLITTSMQ